MTLRNFTFFPLFALLALAAAGEPAAPAASETLPEQTLKQIVARQKTLLADAIKQGDKLDMESFRVQVQDLCHDYELLLHDSPEFAEAYASYGYLLSKLDMPKAAVAVLLKANDLNSNIPLVKNQLGNFLVENGKPLEALNYYLAAIKLDPDEPLYHYQMGRLIHDYYGDFVKSGDWTREQLSDTEHKAFKRAAELAPDRIEFTYRYAESFYDLEKPEWDEALRVWTDLEKKSTTSLERETMRLHEANILIKQGEFGHARVVLAMVGEPGLQAQKEKLIAQLPSVPAK